jgi:hypothetical protein
LPARRSQIDLAELEKLCQLQCTDEEIGAWFGVSTRTVERRRKEPKFAEVMARGRAKGRISVRRAQMRLLEQGNATMGVWLGKQLLGQTDQPVNEIRPRPLHSMSADELREALRPYIAEYPEVAAQYEALNAQYTVVESTCRPKGPNQLTEHKEIVTRCEGPGNESVRNPPS